MSGIFITFEGGEGAGKTTLVNNIFEFLLAGGARIHRTREPGGTKMGSVIRQLLLHPEHMPLDARAELMLYLADRAQHVHEVLKPALENNEIVLCDRYTDSTLAYQGGARGFSDKWIRELCDFVTQGLKPNLTIYLDIDPELGFARIQQKEGTFDRIESETLEFHEMTRRAFLRIAKEEPKRFHVIDASQTPDMVYTQALDLINDTLRRS